MSRELLSVEVTHFADFQHVNDVEPLSDKDHELLSKMRDLLLSHDAVDRFGVHLIHKHFDLGDDEVIVEYTNEEERRQTTQVEKRNDLFSRGKPLETQWRFNRESASMVCVSYCDYNSGHRHIHNQK